MFFSNDWQWQRIGNVVQVTGYFTFNFSIGGFGFAEFTPPPGLVGTPLDTAGGGAVVVHMPPPVGTGNDLAAAYKGLGATGALRFELYDPTGITLGSSAEVAFSISYRAA
ncbi:MAG: hypothetical protein ACRCSL_04720 [Microbacterium sp.]